jgi:type VII secretion protein EccB
VASKRDLVEAHAFNRRRLVTAFTSGAPGGRELEPARPARAVVGGAVLAALVLAGSALAGYLKPGLPEGWDENNLVVAEESASRYLATGDGVLRPVLNIASARLALPAGEFGIVTVPESELAGQRRGETVGIPGAPDELPPTDQLVQSGWTSCIDQRSQTLLRIATTPAAEATGTQDALVVESGGDTWVIWGRRRFPVPANSVNDVLVALRLNGTPARTVPGTWLDLFPEGPALRPLTVAGAGDPAPDGAPPGTVVGSVLEATAAVGSVTRYLLRGDGLVPLTDVAFGLYGVGSSSGSPVPVNQSDLADLTTVTELPYPQEWPADLPGVWPEDVACALLSSQPEEVPVVSLARLTDSAGAPGDGGTVSVEPGRGALVRAVNGSVVNRGTVFLVDNTGRRYAIGGDVGTALEKLGYGDVTPAPVPLPWLEPLADGPELTEAAAQRVVGGG